MNETVNYTKEAKL